MGNEDSRSVALLIPCFNGMHFLPELLQNVNQLDDGFDEIIVYDDASTEPFPFDPTNRFPEVKFHRGTVNRGAAHARNQLLEFARSDYIHFHDIDDTFIPKDFLTVLQPHLDENVVAFSSWEIYWDSKDQDITVFDYPQFEQVDDFCEFFIRSHIHLNAAIYPRKLALEAKFDEELRLMEDLLFNTKISCAGATFIHEKTVFARHIKNKNSTLGRTQLRKFFQYRVLYCQYCKKVLPPKYYDSMGKATLNYAWDACLKGLDSEYKQLIQVARSFGEPTYKQFGTIACRLAPLIGLDWTFQLRRLWFNVSRQ